jgi:hypothetical protein
MGKACRKSGFDGKVGKRPLGWPRPRWEGNIKIDLRDEVWGGMDWINLAHDRNKWPGLMNMVMNLRVP